MILTVTRVVRRNGWIQHLYGQPARNSWDFVRQAMRAAYLEARNGD